MNDKVKRLRGDTLERIFLLYVSFAPFLFLNFSCFIDCWNTQILFGALFSVVFLYTAERLVDVIYA